MYRRVAALIAAASILLAILVIADLSAPSTAQAMHKTTEYLKVADDYWGPHPCAGKMAVGEDLTLLSRGFAGEAMGIAFTWDGAAWQWSIGSCWFTVDPAYHGIPYCVLVVHETGHFAHGPNHDGPMAPETLGPASGAFCAAADAKLQPLPAPQPEEREAAVPRHDDIPKPVTLRQLRYRERKHEFYHKRSKRPVWERRDLATKWHWLRDDARAARGEDSGPARAARAAR